MSSRLNALGLAAVITLTGCENGYKHQSTKADRQPAADQTAFIQEDIHSKAKEATSPNPNPTLTPDEQTLAEESLNENGKNLLESLNTALFQEYCEMKEKQARVCVELSQRHDEKQDYAATKAGYDAYLEKIKAEEQVHFAKARSLRAALKREILSNPAYRD